MIRKLLLFLLGLHSSSTIFAFRPSKVRSYVQGESSIVLRMSYENEIGSLPPTGFWDPLGGLDSL